MANATSNMVAQPGLVSTNPFLGTSPSTSGTRTSAFAPTQSSGGAFGISGGLGTTAPTSTSVNFGSLVPTANAQTKPLSLSPGYVSPASVVGGSTGTATNPYAMTPQEASGGAAGIAAYNARIASLNNSSGNTNGNAAANTYNGGVNGNGQTFPGYVSALGTMASQPTQNFNQNIGTSEQAQTGLINSIPANSAAVQTATQNLQDLENNYQDQTGLIGNSPIGLSEQGGEQGLLNTQYAGKLANAQGALTNALQNNAQTQAAYQQAGGLANTAAGQATSQQSTQQQGIQGAAGLIAPQLASPTNQYGNPQTGTFGPIAATSAGVGGTTAAQALESVGQNITGPEAAGAGIVPLQQALAAGTGAAQNISSYLAENPQLNSSSLNLANLGNQWISGQYSGANAAQYQTLGNYLTTFATQMAPLLAPGGTVTDAARALQQSLINGQANNQTIAQVLAQLTAEAQATLANRASGAAGGGTVAGGSSVTSVPGGTNPPAGYVPYFGTS